MKLSKQQFLLSGFALIFIFYLLNRSKFIIGSEKVTGTFVYYVETIDSAEGKLFYPVIEYNFKDSVYHFKGRENSEYQLREAIPVLLINKDPDQPLLFTLESFWLYPLFYIILPVTLWAAFALSYVS